MSFNSVNFRGHKIKSSSETVVSPRNTTLNQYLNKLKRYCLFKLRTTEILYTVFFITKHNVKSEYLEFLRIRNIVTY